MRQCNVIGLDLRSVLKSDKHYSVYGVYMPLQKGRDFTEEDKAVRFPKVFSKSPQYASAATSLFQAGDDNSACQESCQEHVQSKKKRVGKVVTFFK